MIAWAPKVCLCTCLSWDCSTSIPNLLCWNCHWHSDTPKTLLCQRLSGWYQMHTTNASRQIKTCLRRDPHELQKFHATQIWMVRLEIGLKWRHRCGINHFTLFISLFSSLFQYLRQRCVFHISFISVCWYPDIGIWESFRANSNYCYYVLVQGFYFPKHHEGRSNFKMQKCQPPVALRKGSTAHERNSELWKFSTRGAVSQ